VPQQITEEKIISPLAAAVFNNVQMDRPDVRGRLDDKQVASRISMIAPVEITGTFQAPDDFRHAVEPHHGRSDVENRLRRQAGHSSASYVLQVDEKFAASASRRLTSRKSKRGPTWVMVNNFDRVPLQPDHLSLSNPSLARLVAPPKTLRLLRLSAASRLNSQPA
jgi:hypothetical protein